MKKEKYLLKVLPGIILLIFLASIVSAQYTWTRSTNYGGGGQMGLAVDPTNDNIAYIAGDLGGMYKTVNKGDDWFLIQNNLPNREISSIWIDPLDHLVVYVAGIMKSSSVSVNTNGEIYRSRDGGNSWEVVYSKAPGNGNIAIFNRPTIRNLAFAYDSSNPARFDSDRDGLTDVIIVGGWAAYWGTTNSNGNSGIWKSIDEGNTFTQITLNNRNIYFVKFDPNNPNTVYAGTSGDGLYKSTNLGDSWQKVNIPAPSSHLNSMRISDIAFVEGKNIMYLIVEGHNDKTAPDGVYKSTDGGNSWTHIFGDDNPVIPLFIRDGNGIAGKVIMVDNQDPTGNSVIAGFSGAHVLYMSSDGGNTWKLQYPEMFPSPPGPHWNNKGWTSSQYAFDQGTDGTMYAARSRGASVYDRNAKIWRTKSKGIGNIVVDDVELDPSNPSTAYMTVKDSAAPFKTTDNGGTWTYINSGFDICRGSSSKLNKVSDLSISKIDSQLLFASGYTAAGDATTICKSTNGGSSWNPVCTGLPHSSPTYWIMSVEMSPTNNNIVLLATDESKIYRSTNGGNSWTYIQSIPETYTKFEFTDDGQTVVIGGGQNVYISNNAGLSWSSTSSQPNSGLSVFGVDVCPTNSNKIIAGLNLGGAFLSNDKGNTWNRILGKSDIESFPEYNSLALSDYGKTVYHATIGAVQFDSIDCSTIYLGHTPNSPYTGLGLLRTTDSGENWEIISDDSILNSIRVMDISDDASRIIVGGFEAGVGIEGQGCVSSWVCSEWSPFSTCTDYEQTRTRTCSDTNSCGTTNNKPSEVETVTCSCIHDADGDCNGCIDISELINYISEWKTGSVTISELMDAIGLWKSGC